MAMASNTSEVTSNRSLDGVFEYTGKEYVPMDVVNVRFHPDILEVEEGVPLPSVWEFEPPAGGAFKNRTQLREVVLNEGLKKIGYAAFAGCRSLQRICLPSTVTEIKKMAFIRCTSLMDVTLNEGLTQIGERAFDQCTLLRSITLPSTSAAKPIYRYPLYKAVLNEGLTKIGLYAFRECQSLESITLPSTLTEINKYAFADCTKLREVVMNDELHEIASTVFQNCTSLAWFKFPSIATRITTMIYARATIYYKIKKIPTIKWGDGIKIPGKRQQKHNPWMKSITEVELDREKLDKVVRLIEYYELQVATTLFELALWKANLNQAERASDLNREAYRIEVPGPVKDTILQYIGKQFHI